STPPGAEKELESCPARRATSGDVPASSGLNDLETARPSVFPRFSAGRPLLVFAGGHFRASPLPRESPQSRVHLVRLEDPRRAGIPSVAACAAAAPASAMTADGRPDGDGAQHRADDDPGLLFRRHVS